MPIETIGTPALWLGFSTLVLGCLALDLGVFQREAHVVGNREALRWSVFWISLAMAFNIFVYFRFGRQVALEFLTGFLIEKALSVDNLFVFVLIFSAFSVPPRLYHRVLFWGILGAFVMRGIFIGMGAALVQNFAWILYVFGAFLVITGLRMFVHDDEDMHPDNNPMVRMFRRFIPVTTDFHETSFVTRHNGRVHATPLLVVLVAIEASDVIFAVDSIPAVFAITDDPFIVYTSNVFAILGLRALYFLLANSISQFHYLRYGLAAVLTFIGAKMLAEHYVQVSIGVSLGIVAVLITGSVLASLALDRADERGAD